MAICGDKNWRSGLLGVFSIIGVLAHVIFDCENHALAQITPDGTLGDRSSRITPNVNIKGLPADRIDGGAIRGANLFHSFQEFNVGELQSVYFANPTGISNILTRVTGSNVSNILGTLGVDGGANLFFLNPNGILFGKNARLDVAGSFVASTANSYVFGNGLEFSATNPQTPSALLTVNPSALFFNQLQAGRIENRSIAPAGTDPAGFNAYGLRVADGKSLLLVGGNVSMDGGQLNAYGGRVELGGLAAPGNVNLLFNGDNLSLKFPVNVTRASVSLTNQAFVYVEAADGGDIAVNARNIDILGGSLLNAGIAEGLGKPEATAGNITLNATGEIKVADSGSTISNLVSEDSKGNGGNITIDSGDFSLTDGAQLEASTSGQGKAGNVTVGAKNAVDLANSNILSAVEAGGVGKGGNIDVNATTLSLTDGAQLLTITRGASATQPAGRGDAGNVNLKVTGAVDIAGEKNNFSGGGIGGNGGAIFIPNEGAGGNGGAGGSITIGGNEGNIVSLITILSLTHDARLARLPTITRRAFAIQPAGRGDAGNVYLKIRNALDIPGEKNNFPSGIQSLVETGTVGNGGNIFIHSGDFSLGDGAQLAASTSGVGNAGNVTVGAKDAVDLAGNASILSTVEAGGVGKGGNIDIKATTLSLTDYAQLQTITRGASATQPAGRGDAGNVNLKVTGAVDIAGEKNDFSFSNGFSFSSGILSSVETGTVGNGGNILIASGDFSLRDGAQLSASTSGVGNAGNVTVAAKNAVDLANGNILSTVEAGGIGKGGNIDINATTLSLTDDAQLLTITRGASATQPAGRGDAGNVYLKVTGAVDIAGEKNHISSGIFSNVGTETVGNGGNIFIASGDFSLRDGAQLSASTSGVGNAGNVTVGAKNAVDLANGNILSTVEAGGVGKGGNIDINATTLSLTDGAQLLTITRGASATQPAGRGDAGNVNVLVTGAVDIAGEKNHISSAILSNVGTGTVGNGGNIFIDSGDFSLGDGAQLSASTSGVANAGNVTVGAKNAIDLAGNAYILSTVEAGGVGKGGNIDINATTLSLTDGAQLLTIIRGASATQPAGRGDAGNVNVLVTGAVDIAGEKNHISSGIFSNVDTGTVGNGGNIFIDSGDFSLRDGAQLSASTSGVGNAGNVTVGAKNAVDLANQPTAILSAVEAGGVGKGGNIHINATTLSLTDGAQLLTITRGASATQPAGRGDAGNVNVLVTGAVDIAGEKNGFLSGILSSVETATVGNGGNIFIDSGDFSLGDGAQLSASTSGVGNAGNIRINAKDAITVSGTSQESGFSSALFTFTNSTSTGIGGDITVNTNIFRISDAALLDARTRNNQKGGDITVNANVFEALNGGQLTTTTSSNGRAGKITVNADDNLIISGIDPSYSDRITNFPDNVVNIGANSGLFVSSTGSGITGDIEINSPNIILDNQGKLNAESASGNGGDINLNSDLLLLRRNSQISTNADTKKLGGNGGNININSRFIVAVPKENSYIRANAFTGSGGRVDITSDGLFGIVPQKSPTEKSDITASSQLGVSGTVTIKTPDVDPSHGLIQLPSNIVDASQQIAQGCTPKRGQTASRFIATGRGGLPQSPNEPLQGRAVITGWVDLPPQATPRVTDKKPTTSVTKSTNQIVEAQGWIVDANGDIILVAESGQSSSISSPISCNQ